MNATNVPFPATTLIENSLASRIFGLNDPSVTGIGVTGNSNNLISKSNIGVSGNAFNGNAENIGVEGIVPLGSTSSGTAYNYGGYFSATGSGLQNVGVYAEAANGSSLNYAAIFQGNVLFNGTLSGANNIIISDQMFKTNVDSISNALGIINQLLPKTYFMDTTNVYGMRFSSKKQYGLIAQDVMTIMPELVSVSTKPEHYDSTNNVLNPAVTYKTLNYNAFIAILMKGMQEQQRQIDSLRIQMNACCASNTRIQNPNNNQINVTLTNAESIVLNQNVPNPFAEQTTITFNRVYTD